jgi:hypothetical protein
METSAVIHWIFFLKKQAPPLTIYHLSYNELSWKDSQL